MTPNSKTVQFKVPWRHFANNRSLLANKRSLFYFQYNVLHVHLILPGLITVDSVYAWSMAVGGRHMQCKSSWQLYIVMDQVIVKNHKCYLVMDVGQRAHLSVSLAALMLKGKQVFPMDVQPGHLGFSWFAVPVPRWSMVQYVLFLMSMPWQKVSARP